MRRRRQGWGEGGGQVTSEKCTWWAVALCLVVGYFLLGCGADLSLQLPNDHFIVVANSRDVVITSATGGTRTKLSVGELADTGNFVYGTIVNPEPWRFQEYFVLDTSTSKVDYYPNKQEWATALNAVGVTNLELRGPSAFYSMKNPIWWCAAIAVAFVAILASLVWMWHRSGEKAREHREMQSQPGY